MKRWLKIALIVVVVAALGVFLYSVTTSEPSDVNEGYEVDPNDLDEYRVDVVSHRVVDLENGGKAVIVRYTCTEKNLRSDEYYSFHDVFRYGAEQDGTSLKELPELPAAAAFDTAALHKPIGKGETVEVEVAYELRDNETDVRTNIFVGGHMTNQKKFEKILSIR